VDIVLAAVNARRPRPVDNQNKNLERYTHAVWRSLLYPHTEKLRKKLGVRRIFFVGRGPDMGCGWVMRGQDLRGVMGMGMISIRV